VPNDNITKESDRTSLKRDRRTFGKAVLAGFLGGPAALSSIAKAVKEPLPSEKARGSRSRVTDVGMKLALMLRPENQESWVLAPQIKANNAVAFTLCFPVLTVPDMNKAFFEVHILPEKVRYFIEAQAARNSQIAKYPPFYIRAGIQKGLNFLNFKYTFGLFRSLCKINIICRIGLQITSFSSLVKDRSECS
jgi:hypothetical protein